MKYFCLINGHPFQCCFHNYVSVNSYRNTVPDSSEVGFLFEQFCDLFFVDMEFAIFKVFLTLPKIKT